MTLRRHQHCSEGTPVMFSGRDLTTLSIWKGMPVVASFVAMIGIAQATDTLEGSFALCGTGKRITCVVDGDTFWLEGTKIRIVDIDAPEISEPACQAERRAGEVARERLLQLLNAGPFSLVAGDRDQDRYGRKLRIVLRQNASLGETLIREGLARHWKSPRVSWCR